MSAKRALRTSEAQLPPKSKDLPATQGMLQLVRTELKADVRELRSSMTAEFKQVDAKFNHVDARFNQIDARFNQVDARFNETDAKIERVLGAVHRVASEVARIGVLVEEQNSKNRIVLEGLTGLAQRQDRVESGFADIQKFVRSIARNKP